MKDLEALSKLTEITVFPNRIFSICNSTRKRYAKKKIIRSEAILSAIFIYNNTEEK